MEPLRFVAFDFDFHSSCTNGDCGRSRVASASHHLRTRPSPIVTNAYDGAEQRVRIRACFPHIVFDALVVAGEGTRLKPDSEPFRRLIAELREPANSGLFIGDSPRHDVPGAVEVGLPVVIANASESVRRKARELGAAAVASLPELALRHLAAHSGQPGGCGSGECEAADRV
ncbi:MAG: HAD family hydrolase [Propionibacteriaceae bacterium]